MSSENNDDELAATSTELPWWVTPAIGLIAIGGVAFYFWLVFNRWQHAEQWGDFGSAVGPFVGLLNVGALLAALYSVRLQRRELELQRQELRETRKEMVEQRQQFERTARAQELLAQAQVDATRLQRQANEVAADTLLAQQMANSMAKENLLRSLELELTEHWSTATGLQSQCAQLVVAMHTARGGLPVLEEQRIPIDREHQALSAQMHRETRVIGELEDRIKKLREIDL